MRTVRTPREAITRNHLTTMPTIHEILAAKKAQHATDPINRPDPPPSGAIMRCIQHRTPDGRLYLVGVCPGCGLPKHHESAHGIPLNWFSKRTCITCSGGAAEYWIHCPPIKADTVAKIKGIADHWLDAALGDPPLPSSKK